VQVARGGRGAGVVQAEGALVTRDVADVLLLAGGGGEVGSPLWLCERR
jgi:hypothetical protein